MRRALCCANAADAGCVARGRCEFVCDFTPSDRKIGHTARSTCVYVSKVPQAPRMRFYRSLTEGSQDGAHGKYFQNIIIRAAGS